MDERILTWNCCSCSCNLYFVEFLKLNVSIIFLHQHNDSFNSQPVFYSAVKIDSGRCAEGMINPQLVHKWRHIHKSYKISRNDLCGGAWLSMFFQGHGGGVFFPPQEPFERN